MLFTTNICSQTCVEARYLKEVGVKEESVNWGKDVSKYLKYAGINYPAYWCSAFVKWCLESCGKVTTITAWSPSAFNKNNIVYFHNKFYKTPKAGDVFVLWSVKNKRISHTGFFHKKISETVYETVEGNASDPNKPDSFNGDGVYKKKRSFKATYGISRWE